MKPPLDERLSLVFDLQYLAVKMPSARQLPWSYISLGFVDDVVHNNVATFLQGQDLYVVREGLRRRRVKSIPDKWQTEA